MKFVVINQEDDYINCICNSYDEAMEQIKDSWEGYPSYIAIIVAEAFEPENTLDPKFVLNHTPLEVDRVMYEMQKTINQN